ncbi:MAG: sialidase family protein [Gammaproteobacteria bacterium]|nr:sialidase family protein [Gammaproteobacteria bacterium]
MQRTFHLWIAALGAALCGYAGASFAGDAWTQVSEPGRRAISPEIAVGRDGAINLIWLDKGLTKDRPPPKPRKPGEHSHRSSTDLYFSRSEDGGATWSDPVRVNRESGEVWGFAVSKPRIGVGPTGTIHVFYPANDTSAKSDKDIVSAKYTRSTDNGKTFEVGRTLNRPADFDQEDLLGENLAATFSFGTMAVGPDGSVYAAWQDVGEMADNADGAAAHMAVSRDDGKTFSKEKAVIEGGAVCPCCQLTMAFAGDQVLLGYRKIYGDGRDSTIAMSANLGASFPAEVRLPMARWDINGCPLKTTEMAVDGERIFAAAYTGGEDPPGVYFTHSVDGGKTFAAPVQVHADAPYSDAPQLSMGRNGQVRVIWQAKIDGPRRLFIAETSDDGALGAPRELSTPPGNSAYPATADGPDGQTYVTWQQENEEVFVAVISSPVAATASR